MFLGSETAKAFLALLGFFVLIPVENRPFMVGNLLAQIMQFVSNLLGGMGIVFGLTFVVAVADIGVSYVAKGQTLTEIIQTRVVA